MIYLDNNATTQPSWNMLNAAKEVCYSDFGNPSSQHASGQASKRIIDEARTHLASLISALPTSIIFTSGGTEANNIVLRTALAHKGKVICSPLEHSSVYGCMTDCLNVSPKGDVDVVQLKELLEEYGVAYRKKIVVAVMLANNETGIVSSNLKEVADLCCEYGVHLHIDGVQALGKIPIKPSDFNCDSLSMAFSAHKLHGLKGVGALYFHNENLESYKFMCGGSQEFGVRAGTENQIGIFSFGYMANKLMTDKFYQGRLEDIEEKRDKLELSLSDIAEINGKECERTPNTSSLYFPTIDDAHLLVELLSLAGVYVSSGSACSSGMPGPSKVLEAMYGKDDPRIRNSIRVSLSVDTTHEQIENAVEIIKTVVKDMESNNE